MDARHGDIWKFRSLRTDYEWEGPITACWEVNYDPISDDYLPSEKNARELFRMWTGIVRGKYPDGLIPIYWCVRCEAQSKFESMPFQYDSASGAYLNWLSYFTWPVHVVTGEKLNWLRLPVEDKLWNRLRADKGGFIQELTGWKPAVLQPSVYLPALEMGVCPEEFSYRSWAHVDTQERGA